MVSSYMTEYGTGVPTATADYAAPNGDASVTDDSPDTVRSRFLWTVFAVFVLLVALRFATENDRFGEQPRLVGVGVYNLTVVGIKASLFIALMKLITVKYPVKGLTDFYAMI
jgi:hypothetical protein